MPSSCGRLYVYNRGLLFDKHLRRILTLAGYDLRIGLPREGESVAVWGRSPYARRGERIAQWRGARLVRLEDPFLRSVRPGRAGDLAMGIIIDPIGVYFDSSAPSLIENILQNDPLDDVGLLSRAADAIARMRYFDLSKYNCHDPRLSAPEGGYILVVDQSLGDAGVRHAAADHQTFQHMLEAALDENPDSPIVIKAHPETILGLRAGYFDKKHAVEGRISLCGDAISPWKLLDNAQKIYTVSSLLGFEAILAGHRPQVFGQPFYAGWGLSDDRNPIFRRERELSKEQLFAAAMIKAPIFYDPFNDKLCDFELCLDQLEVDARIYREDRFGYSARGMKPWKRPWIRKIFGKYASVSFGQKLARHGAKSLVWGGDARPSDIRVEDGFLRSRGLGAALVPPLSCVADDLGIYFDPRTPSRLEKLIAQHLPPGGNERARHLQSEVRRLGLSKYNITGVDFDLPSGYRILVPGQVEDDASILYAAGPINTNLLLLQRTRAANPDAIIIYKPHPDVEAGLRKGHISENILLKYADCVAQKVDSMALLLCCDAVWTMTSLMGFEALLRGKSVTCFGAPFYAGWGLTQDLGDVPLRRVARPSLEQLIYAALIAYPRYFDPISARHCPVEVALLRLSDPNVPIPKVNRLLAKIQGHFMPYSDLWRR